MQDVEFKQGPLLSGWAIATGVGLVAAGVSRVVMDFALTPTVAISVVLFLIVGLILGLPRSEPSSPPEPVPAAGAETMYPAPAPLTAAPAAEPPSVPASDTTARPGGVGNGEVS